LSKEKCKNLVLTEATCQSKDIPSYTVEANTNSPT